MKYDNRPILSIVIIYGTLYFSVNLLNPLTQSDGSVNLLSPLTQSDGSVNLLSPLTQSDG